jgi:outer membrane lipoprotein SlyB
MGTIVALRPVQIEGTKTPIGAATGAVIGGVGGSAIGGGRGSIVTAVIGAVAGGLLGSAAESGLTKTQGVEITVREDDGSTRAYVQQVEPNQVFRTGERVRIMTVDGTSRVTQ